MSKTSRKKEHVIYCKGGNYPKKIGLEQAEFTPVGSNKAMKK